MTKATPHGHESPAYVLSRFYVDTGCSIGHVPAVFVSACPYNIINSTNKRWQSLSTRASFNYSSCGTILNYSVFST